MAQNPNDDSQTEAAQPPAQPPAPPTTGHAAEHAPHAPNPDHVYTRPIPAAWILGFVVFIITITIFSLWYTEGNGPITVVNVLLGFIAGSALWLLWLTPSAPGKLEAGECVLGLWILVAGALIGSSPTVQPYLSKAWTMLKLDPRLANPITAPSDENWSYSGTLIVPKSLLPHQRLVIQTPSTPKGVLLTEDGLDVKGLKTVTMWLQDQSTGQTSSSIIVHIKPEVTNPPAPAPDTP